MVDVGQPHTGGELQFASNSMCNGEYSNQDRTTWFSAEP